MKNFITTLVFAALLFAATTCFAEETFLIKFEATWCAPCRVLTRTFNDKDIKERVKDYKFYVVDIDLRKDLMTSYKVTSVPTVVRGVIIDGKWHVVSRFSGNVSKAEILKFLE
jgi:thioredoxin-like negative regulator of GroEL